MSEIAFSIGDIQIYWYSILIMVGVIVGYILAYYEAKRVKIGSSFITDLCFYMIPLGIIGARLYYVIFNFKEFQDNLLSIFYIWEGGLAIYGGVLIGIFFIYRFSKHRGVNVLRTMDVVAPSLILAQAIGRWGNFFNQEAFGPIASSRSVLENLFIPDFIIDNMYITTVEGTFYRHPTFLYESLWCIIGFIIIMLLRYLWKNKKVGSLTAFYFIWYGIGRFLIEGLRYDSLYLGIFRVSQLVSIALIIVGIIILLIRNRELYKGDGEIQYVH